MRSGTHENIVIRDKNNQNTEHEQEQHSVTESPDGAQNDVKAQMGYESLSNKISSSEGRPSNLSLNMQLLETNSGIMDEVPDPDG